MTQQDKIGPNRSKIGQRRHKYIKLQDKIQVKVR